MNAQRPIPCLQTLVSAESSPSRIPPRSQHRVRDFGVGYGSSSGYGVDRRYADARGRAMFRCG